MPENDPNVVMKMVMPDGQIRDITVAELVVTNNMAQEALVRLLVEKGIIDPKELAEMFQNVQKERYHFERPGSSSN